jgi:endoglucanase
MDKIARNSQAQWMTGGTVDIFTAVNNAVTTAAAVGGTSVLVAYNIPQRDCGGLSAGGTTVTDYKSWIAAFANGLAGRKAVVILEPDALTQIDCLLAADQTLRLGSGSLVGRLRTWTRAAELSLEHRQSRRVRRKGWPRRL